MIKIRLPALGLRLLDCIVTVVMGFYRIIDQMLNAAGKGMEVGLFIACVFAAYGLFAWAAIVVGTDCSVPLDRLTGLFPTYADMPRPVGIPSRTPP